MFVLAVHSFHFLSSARPWPCPAEKDRVVDQQEPQSLQLLPLRSFFGFGLRARLEVLPLLIERLGDHDGALRQQVRKSHSLFFRLAEALTFGTRRLRLPPPVRVLYSLVLRGTRVFQYPWFFFLSPRHWNRLKEISSKSATTSSALADATSHILSKQVFFSAASYLCAAVLCCAPCAGVVSPKGHLGKVYSLHTNCRHTATLTLPAQGVGTPGRVGDAASLQAPVKAAQTPVRAVASKPLLGVVVRRFTRRAAHLLSGLRLSSLPLFLYGAESEMRTASCRWRILCRLPTPELPHF